MVLVQCRGPFWIHKIGIFFHMKPMILAPYPNMFTVCASTSSPAIVRQPLKTPWQNIGFPETCGYCYPNLPSCHGHHAMTLKEARRLRFGRRHSRHTHPAGVSPKRVFVVLFRYRHRDVGGFSMAFTNHLWGYKWILMDMNGSTMGIWTRCIYLIRWNHPDKSQSDTKPVWISHASSCCIMVLACFCKITAVAAS